MGAVFPCLSPIIHTKLWITSGLSTSLSTPARLQMLSVHNPAKNRYNQTITREHEQMIQDRSRTIHDRIKLA